MRQLVQGVEGPQAGGLSVRQHGGPGPLKVRRLGSDGLIEVLLHVRRLSVVCPIFRLSRLHQLSVLGLMSVMRRPMPRCGLACTYQFPRADLGKQLQGGAERLHHA